MYCACYLRSWVGTFNLRHEIQSTLFLLIDLIFGKLNFHLGDFDIPKPVSGRGRGSYGYGGGVGRSGPEIHIH